MRLLILLSIIAFSFSSANAQTKTLYDFTVKTIEGETFPLSQLKGKKVMVVNTASKCGLTPQYELLEKLYKQYKGQNFVIIGFPANNFLSQEPGSNADIAEFCSQNYGVTFPMMAKISVKGDDIHPLYQWLTSKKENGVVDSDVSWNFQKFLIDEQGRVVQSFSPRTKPNDEEIVSWITQK
ncbi:MAG: glutathione peroxidase [Bacteroidales bacterium]|jgi:glutathione peroxidase|nr:glutathione peroxidase [Bacteroidales bacterium]MDD4384231.1 glutathione peroxidase [Bacteroidales bacterium]MDY0197498.1 glutathione peroxidase [Tenuifilaceae bacterium]